MHWRAVITTNLEFGEWVSVFGPFRQICFTNRLPGNGRQDDSAALAFLDRVTHHCSILETGNTSFRFAQSKKSRNQ